MAPLRTIEPPAFVTVGASVAVLDHDENGPTRLRFGTVEKIFAQHFTVSGIVTPGGSPRPVRFSNRVSGTVRHLPRTADDVSRQATGESPYPLVVLPSLDDSVEVARAIIKRRRAVRKLAAAADQWRAVERRTTSVSDYDNRPVEGELDAALVALADAVLAMRVANGAIEPVA